ncbi:SMK killer toxin resistance protein [Lecanora helva]
MATFLTDLFNSIFTPGPTPSIVVATNASFTALQIVLLALLISTYSVHFAILSCLSAGLWWAINWFVTELEAANEKQKKAKEIREIRRGQEDRNLEDSGTETEGASNQQESMSTQRHSEKLLTPDDAQGSIRKRRNSGEVSSSDLSTDSEWDKVDEAGEMGR